MFHQSLEPFFPTISPPLKNGNKAEQAGDLTIDTGCNSFVTCSTSMDLARSMTGHSLAAGITSCRLPAFVGFADRSRRAHFSSAFGNLPARRLPEMVLYTLACRSIQQATPQNGELGHAFSEPSSLNVVREQLSVLRRSAGRPDRYRAQGRNSTDIHTECLPHTLL